MTHVILGFLRILGRGKDLIIVGGFNVYPKEVEDCIEKLPGVTEAAVIGAVLRCRFLPCFWKCSVMCLGVPHKDLGEAMVAVVSVNDASSVDSAKKEREIIEALKKVLGKYKVVENSWICLFCGQCLFAALQFWSKTNVFCCS